MLAFLGIVKLEAPCNCSELSSYASIYLVANKANLWISAQLTLWKIYYIFFLLLFIGIVFSLIKIIADTFSGIVKLRLLVILEIALNFKLCGKIYFIFNLSLFRIGYLQNQNSCWHMLTFLGNVKLRLLVVLVIALNRRSILLNYAQLT